MGEKYKSHMAGIDWLKENLQYMPEQCAIMAINAEKNFYPKLDLSTPEAIKTALNSAYVAGFQDALKIKAMNLPEGELILPDGLELSDIFK